MYTGLRHLHSANRYIILILLVLVVFSSLNKWLKKKEYTSADNRLNLFAFISSHIQLLTGLILYPMSDWVDFGNLGNKYYRFFAVEHLIGMLIAIALITIGRIKMKKLSVPYKKHKVTFVYYFIALILILASIPWPFRNVGINNWF